MKGTSKLTTGRTDEGATNVTINAAPGESAGAIGQRILELAHEAQEWIGSYKTGEKKTEKS